MFILFLCNRCYLGFCWLILLVQCVGVSDVFVFSGMSVHVDSKSETRSQIYTVQQDATI
jgi:hypothetical protein